MSCNWELFEFRVLVMIRLVAKSYSRLVGEGLLFWEVFPDLKTLGIGDFQGANDYCDFKTVFNQLVKLKMIPFKCPQKNNTGNQFGRLQTAEKGNEHLPVAKLYVHRRDQSDIDSDIKGVGVLLEGVDVIFTSANNGNYYAQLQGDAASTLNF